MTNSDDDRAADAARAGLLVLSTDPPDQAALARLYAALDERGFRRGHLVGPVLPVTASREALQTLADHVAAARGHSTADDADVALVDALAPVEDFAWDEGAETF